MKGRVFIIPTTFSMSAIKHHVATLSHCIATLEPHMATLEHHMITRSSYSHHKPSYDYTRVPDLENVTIHTIQDGVTFSRVWVKLVTEHTVFCRKFNLLSQFCIFGG